MKRILNILVMCALVAVAAAAQTATVKSFAPSLNDLTAQKYSRDDKNGVKCAVVKVQVIASNVQFKGGIIEPVDRQPGEYWVYMPGLEQRLQVLSDDFKPLMVEFPQPLQSGVTYVLDIEAPQRAAATALKSAEQNQRIYMISITAHSSETVNILGKKGYAQMDSVIVKRYNKHGVYISTTAYDKGILAAMSGGYKFQVGAIEGDMLEISAKGYDKQTIRFTDPKITSYEITLHPVRSES